MTKVWLELKDETHVQFFSLYMSFFIRRKYMGTFEIIMIGIGLSMDAVAVSLSNGLGCAQISKDKIFAMPLFFGVFQGLMPFLGYYAGRLFANEIEQYSGIIILIILGFIGGKMVYDGLFSKGEEACTLLTYRLLFIQAIATSIDAFAVGVGFASMQIDIVSSVFIIGITTLILSYLALVVGKYFKSVLGSKAQVLGGIILIVIGIRAFF